MVIIILIIILYTSFVQLKFLGGKKNLGLTLVDRANPTKVCAWLICAKCWKSESKIKKMLKIKMKNKYLFYKFSLTF